MKRDWNDRRGWGNWNNRPDWGYRRNIVYRNYYPPPFPLVYPTFYSPPAYYAQPNVAINDWGVPGVPNLSLNLKK
jgi:hypothetical protein